MRRTFLSKRARTDEIRIDFARTVADMERTFKLVRDRYCESGYLCPQKNRLWLNVHHALPETRILLAYLDKKPSELLITATVVHDTPIGLPSEKLYPQEILELKEKGRNIAEVCSLARSRHERADYSFMNIVRLIIIYGQTRGIDDYVISVNPDHASFYINYLLFEQLGDRKEHPSLEKAPAVLLRLDMKRYQRELHLAYRNAEPEYNLAHYFFEGTHNIINQIINHAPQKIGISASDLCNWLLFETDIWQSLPERKKQYINTLYPGLEEHFLLKIS